MKYHAPTGEFTVSKSDIEMAAHSFIYSIRNIREAAGLPMTKYKREGPLEAADHAQKGLIDAAKYIGIDLGAEWGEDLDVSERDDD